MVGPHRLPCETPAIHRAEAGAPSPSPWVLPVTILGSSLGFIDSSVVNVALPAMQRGLGQSIATLPWVVNGYLLNISTLIMLAGQRGDCHVGSCPSLLGIHGLA